MNVFRLKAEAQRVDTGLDLLLAVVRPRLVEADRPEDARLLQFAVRQPILDLLGGRVGRDFLA